jgi:hypothetical protein
MLMHFITHSHSHARYHRTRHTQKLQSSFAVTALQLQLHNLSQAPYSTIPSRRSCQHLSTSALLLLLLLLLEV